MRVVSRDDLVQNKEESGWLLCRGNTNAEKCRLQDEKSTLVMLIYACTYVCLWDRFQYRRHKLNGQSFLENIRAIIRNEVFLLYDNSAFTATTYIRRNMLSRSLCVSKFDFHFQCHLDNRIRHKPSTHSLITFRLWQKPWWYVEYRPYWLNQISPIYYIYLYYSFHSDLEIIVLNIDFWFKMMSMRLFNVYKICQWH